MKDMDIELSIISQILFTGLDLLLFLIGLFINLKIILVCWKEKEGKTWQLHMIHSIAVIINFAFNVPFWRVTYSIPNLSTYTGEWFCYLATFIQLYGFYIVSFNSLLIAVIKYVFIVHSIRSIKLGDAKIKRAFLIFDLTLPFVLATVSCVMKDIEHFSDLVSCFGLRNQVQKQYTTPVKNMEKFFLCNLHMTTEDISKGYTLYAMRQCVCLVKSTVVIIINTNLPEAYFYYKIFRKMKWYDFYALNIKT